MAADPSPPTPGPTLPSGPATMLELGAALGADVWWLEQIFAVTGGWVPTTPEAGVRIHWAELSRVAGEHAGTLRSLLPRPAAVDPAAWVVPPAPGATPLVAELGAAVGSPERLAVVHRVLLPRLLVAWGAPVGASAVGVARALRHARSDGADLRDEGEALLHALLVDDGSVARAHARAVGVETALVAVGGVRPVAPDVPPS